MPQLVAVTSKGQVTIPVDIRHMWGLEPFHKVVFIKKEKVVEIKPAVDFFQLKGLVKTKKTYSDKKADQFVGKYLSKHYASQTQNH